MRRKVIVQNTLKSAVLGLCLVATTGCSQEIANKIFNPFAPDPVPEAYLGTENDHSLLPEKTDVKGARKALETMTEYRRAQKPQPYNPVIQPAVVRLMWVPDHLSPHGDLVPAHYYYLKVLSDRWAVQDSFDLYNQLDVHSDGTPNATGSIPFVKK